MFKVPILFIAFDSIKTAQKVFYQIKLYQPSKLFFAVDAPHSGDVDEEINCTKVKDLIKNIDYPCEINCFFAKKNLGPRLFISSAINWFFSQVEYGIILEHDCFPDLSFFQFCQELLMKYKNEEKIMHISGNFFQPLPIGKASYYFSHIPNIWGWATWRRAWQYYDISMKDFPIFYQKKIVEKIFPEKIIQKSWLDIFKKYYEGFDDSWDWQWSFALMNRGGLSINPNVNLVKNIGFYQNSLHTKNPKDRLNNLPLSKINFPLVHPSIIEPNLEADKYLSRKNLKMTYGYYYGRKILNKLHLLNLIKSLFKL